MLCTGDRSTYGGIALATILVPSLGRDPAWVPTIDFPSFHLRGFCSAALEQLASSTTGTRDWDLEFKDMFMCLRVFS